MDHHYRCFDVTATSLDAGNVLIHSRHTDTYKIYPAALAQTLLACQAFDTLQNHAIAQAKRQRRSLLHSGSTSFRQKLLAYVVRFAEKNDIELPLRAEETDPIRQQLLQFVDDGFLISAADLRQTVKEACTATAKDGLASAITTIGITTCHRPAALEQALGSYLTNSRRHGRATGFIVIDDSKETAAQTKNRRLTQQAREKHAANVAYIDRSRRQAFAWRLADTAQVPSEVAAFGLLSEERQLMTYGAAVNTLLLRTAGEMIFLSDDDMMGRSAPAPGQRSGLALASKPPYQYWFFEDRASAARAAAFKEEDVLGFHEQLLGQNVRSYLSEHVTHDRERFLLDDMGPTFLRNMKRADSTVVATFPGLVGESGSHDNLYRLFTEEDTFDRLTSGPLAYRTALRTGEIIKAIPHLTISNDTYCMSGAMGIDNRRLLPPFMPDGRNCDGTFSYVLDACFPETFRGHLPHILLHDAPGSHLQPPSITEIIKGPRINDLLQWLIASFRSHLRNQDGRKNMEALGRQLMDIGALQAATFEECVREVCRHTISRRVQKAARRLETTRKAPEAWREDVQAYIEAHRRGLTQREFFAPSDLEGAYKQRMAAGQDLIYKYGRLLTYWPAMIEASKELRAADQPLAANI